MGWPNSAARRSNTRRGTTSAALPAPNGMVALISRDGQFSACAVKAAKKLAKTHINRMDLNRIDLRINRSGFVSGPVARTLQEAYRVFPLSPCGRGEERDRHSPNFPTLRSTMR